MTGWEGLRPLLFSKFMALTAEQIAAVCYPLILKEMKDRGELYQHRA